METKHYSQWKIDQFYGGYLSDTEAASLQTHLHSCKQCLTRYNQIKQDAETIAHTPLMYSLLQARQPTPLSPQKTLFETIRWWSFNGLSIAVLTGLILFFSPSQEHTLHWQSTPVPQPAHQTRKMQGKSTKAHFGLIHFHKGQQYSQWTKNKETLQPGDLIQFAYQVPQDMYVMIVGINQKAEVSSFYPMNHSNSILLRAGTGILPNKNKALELDDYIGKERLFMVTASQPFSFAELKRAVLQSYRNTSGQLEQMKTVSGMWQVKTLLIQKVKKINH